MMKDELQERISVVKHLLRQRFAARDWHSMETYKLASEYENIESRLRHYARQETNNDRG